MNKCICLLGGAVLIILLTLPVQAQFGSGGTDTGRPTDGFIGVDLRPIEPGSGGRRYQDRSLRRTYTTKINYKATGLDDEMSCRIVANEEAKQNLAEQIDDDVVDYYESEVSLKYDLDPIDPEYIKYFIPVLIPFETTKDKWKNNELQLTVEATANANDIIRVMAVLQTNKPLTNRIMKNRKRAEAVFDEIRGLKKNAVASVATSDMRKAYMDAIDRLQAADLLEKGLLSGFLKEEQSAFEAFDKAADLDPTHAEALYYRGIYCYSHKKDPQKALEDLNRAIALNSDDPGFFESRAICYHQLGNSRLAIEDLNQAITLDHASSRLYAVRGSVFEKMDNQQKAIEDYAQAIKFNPKHLQAHYRMGFIHKAQENFEASIKDFGQVIELNDQLPEVYYQRAMAYAYLKNDENKDKIIKDFQSAARLGHEGAQEVLKNINVEW